MTLSLTPRQRTLLLFLSASGYTAWFSGLGDRTEAEVLGTRSAPIVTIDAPSPLPRVASVIRRDPFASKPQAKPAHVPGVPPLESGDANSAAIAVANTQPVSKDGVVVPDIEIGSATPLALLLRATIVGPQPVAYVANGTAMDIVRVGDTLGERRVAQIDLRGISFADGTRLDLPDAFVPTPRPERRRAKAGDPITLQALRRLLLSTKKQDAATVPEPAEPAPSAGSVSNYPTPGPLPTVDMQGLPVGVNPTANPNAPTPYPYPYPYAPPVRH